MDKIVTTKLDRFPMETLENLEQAVRLRNQRDHPKAWEIISAVSSQWKKTNIEGILNLPLSKFSPEELPLLVKFLDEVSICAYYLGENGLGLLACDLLFCVKAIVNKQMAGNNLQFYVDAMPSAAVIDLGNHFVTFPKYSRSNPSVINWEDDLMINCRLVNYTQQGATQFKSNDSDGKIRTRNLIRRCRLDETGHELINVGPVSELVDENNGYKTGESMVLGMEDIRLFKVGDDCWCLATSQCASIHTKVSTVLCYLGPSKIFQRSTKTQAITVSSLKVDKQQNCEKNWNILIDQQRIYLVYKIYPTTLYLLADLNDPNNNLAKAKHNFGSDTIELSDPIVMEHPYLDMGDARGGSNYIPYQLEDKDGFLCIAHQVVFRNNRRYYYHRWIFLVKKDGGYGLHACSGLFYILEQGIEFAMSLSKHPKKDLYYVGCGIEDKEAMLFCYDKEQIDKQMKFY